MSDASIIFNKLSDEEAYKIAKYYSDQGATVDVSADGTTTFAVQVAYSGGGASALNRRGSRSGAQSILKWAGKQRWALIMANGQNLYQDAVGSIHKFRDRLSGRHDNSEPEKKILNDARLLIAYAHVHGYAVPNDLDKRMVELNLSGSGRALSSTEVQSLNDIISACLKLISPNTIANARTYYHDSFKSPGILAAIVNVLAIYLIFLVIALTGSFNIATSALSDLSKIDLSSYLEVLKDTYDLAHSNSSDNAAATKTKDNIRQLRKSDSAIITASGSLGALVPMIQQDSSPNWCMILLGNFISCGAPASKGVQPDAAGDSTGNSSSVAVPDVDQVTVKNLSDLKSMQMFGASIGLNLADVDTVKSLYLIQAQASHLVMILGGFVLPLLYGLLGASVFLMRQFFGDAPVGNRLHITIGRTFLRLGLGGVAGLAIGWFWVPSATRNVADITTTPFAIAFLAGFSIELLFSMLDRIISAIGTGGQSTANVTTAN